MRSLGSAGSEVEEVYAMGAVLIDPAIGDAGDVDTAVTTLKMANGALAVIENSRQAVYGYDQRVEVFGSKGSAEAANETANRVTVSGAGGVRRHQVGERAADVDGDAEPAHRVPSGSP